MTVQRRRGEEAVIVTAVLEEDNRGNSFERPTLTSPRFKTRVWEYADRSSKAEVPGQMEIDLVKIGLSATNPLASKISTTSRVYWKGHWWDVAAPAAYHPGPRQTRHISLSLRRRPDDGGFYG